MYGISDSDNGEFLSLWYFVHKVPKVPNCIIISTVYSRYSQTISISTGILDFVKFFYKFLSKTHFKQVELRQIC